QPALDRAAWIDAGRAAPGVGAAIAREHEHAMRRGELIGLVEALGVGAELGRRRLDGEGGGECRRQPSRPHLHSFALTWAPAPWSSGGLPCAAWIRSWSPDPSP